MRTPIQWAELHAPLFLCATNLQLKLDPKIRAGLSMEYDEEKRHLYVTFNNGKGAVQTARIPETSVLSMVEAAPVVRSGRAVVGSDIGIDSRDPPGRVEQFTSGIASARAVEAQVSTPTSHVFAGPGGGSTGQEEPVKRGPGRPKNK